VGIAVAAVVGPVVSPEQATTRAITSQATANRIFFIVNSLGDYYVSYLLDGTTNGIVP
jgi:hypothetical protein